MAKGFSLIETVIVLALVSLVIYGASNAFLGNAPKHRLNKAAWEIQTRLSYARHKAIFEGHPFRVRFQTAGYIVEEFDSAANSWRPEASGLCEGVAIEANNSPTFHPVGTVSNLATITISNTAGIWRITLAISGRIKAVMM
jgi:prepilin-type N-terminal cleavage/methylation domain-containing protein